MKKLLEDIHAVTSVHTGMHFVYTGEQHGDGYVNYRALGQRPEYASLLRKVSLLLFSRILKKAQVDLTRPVTLVGPKTFGAQMASQVFFAARGEFPSVLPRQLLECRTLKKDSGVYIWSDHAKRPIDRKAQVVWLDDMLNEGSTLKAARPLITAHGAELVAVGVIGDRSGMTARDLGARHLEVLERFKLKRYAASDCPLCKQHVPIVRRPGHGYEYEKTHPDYPGGFANI